MRSAIHFLMSGKFTLLTSTFTLSALSHFSFFSIFLCAFPHRKSCAADVPLKKLDDIFSFSFVPVPRRWRVAVSCGMADTAARINVRKARIAARASSEAAKLTSEAEGEVDAVDYGRQQIVNSLETMERELKSSTRKLTSIRLAAEIDEAEHRRREEDARMDRAQMLQDEAIESNEANAELNAAWAGVYAYRMPKEQYEAIQVQQQKCRDIIASKTHLMQLFQDDLRAKDEEYIKALKRQADDVEKLIRRMNAQYAGMRDLYGAEIEKIEEEFLRERKETIDRNAADLDELFDKRRESETNFMAARQRIGEEQASKLETMRVKDNESYTMLKIKLETQIQTLEQQLEQMRATYQLNREKLDYNLQMLMEKCAENKRRLGVQKSKLARLQRITTEKTEEYRAMTERYEKENIELTQEYGKITSHYNDLQTKFRHFQLADQRKYDQVWAMHVEELEELAEKLLKADAVITEQQLGWVWRAPARLRAPGSADAADADETLLQSQRPPSAAAFAEQAGETAQGEREAIFERKVRNGKVKALVEALCSEAGFLVPPEVRATMGEIGDDGDRRVMSAYAILQALGVEAEEDVAALLDYFFADAEQAAAAEDEAAASKEEQSTGDGGEAPDAAASLALQIAVKPDDIAAVLTRFVADRAARAGGSEGAAGASAAAGSSPAKALDAKATRVKRGIAYLQQLADTVPEGTGRVWSALEQGLENYDMVLEERTALSNEVRQLEQDNSDLKALLHQYLSSKVNSELQIPPTQVIRVQNRRR